MSKQDRMDAFDRFMDYVINPDELSELQAKLNNLGFFDKPASINHHGNHAGDLCWHSLDVARNLVWLTASLNLKWERNISPYIIGIFHDLCKCDLYYQPPEDVDPEHWEYNNATILTGHGEKSVILAQKIMPLTDEEIACIRWHMGAFDEKMYWNNYGHAITVYPNVLYTHTADMIAARIHDI